MAPIILSAPLEGWVTPLEAVPDPVFAGRMLGDGIAIDPTGDTLHAPCAGRIVGLQSTGHAITIEAENGAQILMHLGIDTVALDGRGFTPLVAIGDEVASGDPLIRFDLDLLVQSARAVITPILLTETGGTVVSDIAAPGPIAVGAALMTLQPTATSAGAPQEPHDASGISATRTLRIDLPHGLHARPAARIAALARERDATVTIAKGDRSASARSPTGMLGLGIAFGDEITLSAHGDDADQALDALVALIAGGMGEAPATPAIPSPSLPPSPVPDDLAPGTIGGVCAAPGLAVGPVRQHRTADIEVPVHGRGIAVETQAFDDAHSQLVQDVARQALAARGPAQAILQAHAALLDDPELREATNAGIARGESAGHAWRMAIRQQADILRTGGNARLAERADDLLDLERRLLALLVGAAPTADLYAVGTILIADDLLPSDLIAIPEGLAALCIARGGPTSHVAILAASMGLPTLVAAGAAVLDIAEGTRIIVDANKGRLLSHPTADEIAVAEAQQAATARRRADALATAAAACHTADGTRIEVFANLGAASEAAPAVANGAEGCGLLRTEFLFLDRDTAPSVAEQHRDYQAIADGLAGRPLIVRLLDIGGDKPAPYLTMAAEENPALGLRGIRVGLAHPALLEDQLRAILQVQPIGQCRIMLPMVARVEELRDVRRVLDRLSAEMEIATPIALGIMVETPAAAVTADTLAREADFLSIGTNDLTQYTLAMDRANPAVASALDGLHPAVLRLIAQTCRGGATHGRWTGVCGSLASDPLAVPILLGLGVTELSAAPAMVPTIKARVREISLEACRAHAQAVLACASAPEVRTLARRFASEETPA
ncbi:phosphoenolpyruvate--protein phosphotransferase [Sphingomonas sp. CARO-RG-8B-R24-01]|uniref:phosphoenolpyruvate--protein phosphotransferase n=1 Tax=Sphingomonas sp. CARO-RG-8B-R24-01 TaxID=2914831 RepID=UPI001F564986|nr:phosphoenolpyruvate--protein phosphotransferase [Sphingomonas sp. CARO-RG-8B-R24-01]